MLLNPSITERVRGEFREMPGLTLTVAQARRLWSLDPSTCSEILTELVETGFLCRKADGAYGRASDLAARSMRMAKAGIQLLDLDQPRRIGVEG
jgi:DNA-binding IclR family transcriptional regulator